MQQSNEKKCCGTCNWHDEWTGACCNGDSDYRADFTDAESTCDCWEGQNEQG